VALHHGVHRQLDRASQPQSPGWTGNGPGEDTTRRACSNQMVLKNIHDMSVSHKNLRFKRIDPTTGGV
jgi:hypothetical protein